MEFQVVHSFLKLGGGDMVIYVLLPMPFSISQTFYGKEK